MQSFIFNKRIISVSLCLCKPHGFVSGTHYRLHEDLNNFILLELELLGYTEVHYHNLYTLQCVVKVDDSYT